MITTVGGSGVLRLVENVRRNPERFAELLICSPFLDEELSRFVADLTRRTARGGCGFRIVTRPAAAAMILASLPTIEARWSKAILVHRDLHAKAYFASSRAGVAEAIVTSANLTSSGVTSNLEFGVRAASTSVGGRQLVGQVGHFLRRLIGLEATPCNANRHK